MTLAAVGNVVFHMPANQSGGAPAAITATFNWDVKPDGTDFSNAIVVTLGGAAVAGTYAVTIDHVVSLAVQNDGIKIRTPYIFTFSAS